MRLRKKQDLIFCLDAPPEVIQTRKQEVSFEETTRQREAYRELVSKLPNGQIIIEACLFLCLRVLVAELLRIFHKCNIRQGFLM